MVHAWVIGSGSNEGNRGTFASSNPGSNRYKKVEGERGGRRSGVAKREAGWKLARLSFLFAAFVILFAGFSFMRSYADESVAKPASAEERVVLVDSGDTLWSIAESVKQEGMDTRAVIHQIKKRNDLTSSSLRSGDRLIIPATVLKT